MHSPTSIISIPPTSLPTSSSDKRPQVRGSRLDQGVYQGFGTYVSLTSTRPLDRIRHALVQRIYDPNPQRRWIDVVGLSLGSF